MQMGQMVESHSYPEKGHGLIVGFHTFAGQGQAEVFFEQSREKLVLPASDLVSVASPRKKMEQGVFAPAQEFILRLLLEQAKARKTKEGFQSAGGFKILPLPHQLLAVDFVLSRLTPRALIADEVGLGKTIEAALIYEELKARELVKRVLIIAPAGLCYQWQAEMEQKFGEVFSLYNKETVLSLKNLHGRETNVWTLQDKIIASLDFIKPRRVGDLLSAQVKAAREWHNTHVTQAAVEAGFDLVIFDEAHKLSKDESGEETARYKVGRALAEAVPYLLLLTATPHQGDLAKFKNLLGLIDAHLFVSPSDVHPKNVSKVTVRNNKRAAVDFEGRRIFKRRITSLYQIERQLEKDRIEIDLYNKVSRYVSDFYNLAARKNDRVTMFLLLIYQRMVSSSSRAILVALRRRLKRLQQIKKEQFTDHEHNENLIEDSFDDLKERAAEEQLLYLEASGTSFCLQEDVFHLEREIKELQTCINLAQQATYDRNDVKLEKLLKVISEFIVKENDPKLKFIIFTEFVETQAYICNSLNDLGYEVALINGSMTLEEKENQKDYFKNQAQFLVSTDAGGEGINLQFCHVMINYDLPWNPMRLEQRIGRIDRIGQQHDVKVINFQLKNTVEQRVRDVIETKLERVKREFNQGEDKLSDILSTLEDEFDFEKIYIDAVSRLQADEKELDKIGSEIYQKARDIIRQGELTLPFSELQADREVSRWELEQPQQDARAILTRYLRLHNKQLYPYKGKKGVYYFEDPCTGKRLSKVYFDQQLALKHDDAQLMSFNHDYMKALVERLDKKMRTVETAKLRVVHSAFASSFGYLFVFKLAITNNIDPPRVEIIPSFVDSRGQTNYRISQIFSDVAGLEITSFVGKTRNMGFSDAQRKAKEWAEERAEAMFSDYRKEVLAKIAAEQEKMEKYYKSKRRSVAEIAIKNIRDSKLKELEQVKEALATKHNRRKLLVPVLDCLQIAYVEFC
mgnify:FL=1